jgi:hypothetical protein
MDCNTLAHSGDDFACTALFYFLFNRQVTFMHLLLPIAVSSFAIQHASAAYA